MSIKYILVRGLISVEFLWKQKCHCDSLFLEKTEFITVGNTILIYYYFLLSCKSRSTILKDAMISDIIQEVDVFS